jgi:hypothetical protein
MEKTIKSAKCSQCREFISFNKSQKVGKCLRDSKYKNPETDGCDFGAGKTPENT